MLALFKTEKEDSKKETEEMTSGKSSMSMEPGLGR